jgi:hypothetical protein
MREEQRRKNRAAMQKAMPEFLSFIDALRAAGMGGKLVSLTIHEDKS